MSCGVGRRRGSDLIPGLGILYAMEQPKKKKTFFLEDGFCAPWILSPPFIYLFIFRVTPVAYGSSQARGWITAAAAGHRHSHSNVRFFFRGFFPSHVCNLHHSSQQRQILNPLSKARDQTCNLMVPSQIHFRCTTTGTPRFVSLTIFNTLKHSPVLSHTPSKQFLMAV